MQCPLYRSLEMKTEQESSNPTAPSGDRLTQELRPQVNAIVKMVELLKTKSATDENLDQIILAARGLLDVISSETAKQHEGNGADRAEPAQQCDVLYIEDNPNAFSSVKLLLKTKRALKILQAPNGENGCALAAALVPKLILLDLDLPDIHGSEVIQRLQKGPATAHIPVVVISGDATASQIERLLVLGARNYLTKPLTVEPFLAVIDEVLQENAR
jgi:CheY-like chemotaxis protein